MAGLAIEEMLEISTSALRDVEERLRPLFKLDRVAQSVGGGRPDQFDDGVMVGHWAAPSVLRDVTKQAVLYLVPLRTARRIVVDIECQNGLIGQLLMFYLPHPLARTVRAHAVGRDRQLAGCGIALAIDPR